MKTKIVLIFAVACLLAVLIFVPIDQTVVVPPWTVRFEDEAQKPLSNLKVKQEWFDYTYEFMWPLRHSETLVTNQDGVVIFPERVISISILTDSMARIRKSLTLNPHESFGPFSTVNCDGEEFTCYEAFSKDDPVPLTVKVFRKRTGQ